MKLHAPKGCDGVTLMDIFYSVDAHGNVDVPDAVAAGAIAAGYEPVTSDVQSAPSQPDNTQEMHDDHAAG